MALGRRKVEVWDGTERRAPAAVLVVGEAGESARMLAGLLACAGYRAESTTDLPGTLAVVRAGLPRCIVLAAREGGIGSNLKLLDLIRSHDDTRIAQARVVLCAPSTRNRSFAFESGADAVLAWPFHAEELIQAVAEVVAVPQVERSIHRRRQLDPSS